MSKDGHQIQPGDTRLVATAIPWTSITAWNQANSTLQHLCTRHRAALDSAGKSARDLKNCLETLFPVLDSLCGRTCPACQTPCCHVATVWFDFKDLVFLHLNGLEIATAQLNRTPEGVCCHCGPSGCRLPRLSRPWTCTWYLCPPQKDMLTDIPVKTLVRFKDAGAAIKQLRKKLEVEFIRITS